jgi:type VII secretion-associated serine protease mycosin
VTIRQLPWAQKTLNPESVWPFTRGSGQTVAVLDSGVDASQPQLAGHVIGSGPARSDCSGHGTQVAGVIVAQHQDGAGFEGLAPAAKVLPITVTPSDQSGVPDPTKIDPKRLAAGIDSAVSHGAHIITMSAISYRDDPALQQAVRRAQEHGALIVAAVGDDADDGSPTPYPAAYSGVLGVGALSRDGSVVPSSQAGRYVDLVAPGDDIVTTQRASGLTTVEGTAYAAGFVSAIAALTWSAHPDLNVEQLAHRLTATAAPGGEAPGGAHYGQGIADPYQAVTGVIDDGPRQSLPRMPGRHHDRAAEVRATAWSHSMRWALIGTGAGLLLVALVVAAAVYLPRGSRRRWRPGLSPGPEDDPESDQPSPPVHLFPDENTDRR